MTAGYDYGAKLGLAPAGLAPASTAASLAASTSKVDILPSGERLLRSEADWLKTNPAERWVGGVSIDPQETLNWRFDEDRGTVCRQ